MSYAIPVRVMYGFLSIWLTFIGAIKLYAPTPMVGYYFFVKFEKYAKVCPTNLFNYTPEVDTYKITVGVFEVFCGLALMLGDAELKIGSCYIIMLWSVLSVYTQLLIDDPLGIVGPIVYFISLSFLLAYFCNKEKQKLKQE